MMRANARPKLRRLAATSKIVQRSAPPQGRGMATQPSVWSRATVLEAVETTTLAPPRLLSPSMS